MSSTVKSFLFALVTAVVCSFLLTAASAGLKGFQLENIEVDKKKNILKAVGLLESADRLAKEAIQDIYSNKIRGLWVTPEGEILDTDTPAETSLPVYLYVRDGNVAAYILPVNTRGLWGKIFGYLALESDGSTVSGFTVYKHSETPGLGGEIEKRWFQSNFKGKKILDRSGNLVSISIAKGSIPASFPEEQLPHYVDGISGATLTGRFLTAGLKRVLLDYEPISIKFRSRMTIEIKEE